MVVKQLRPFIVTSWHGHREDRDLPAAVRSVWSRKFRQQPRPGPDRSAGRNENRNTGRAAGRNRRTNGGRSGERNGGRGPGQSNVDLAVLDPSGRVVYSFDAFHRQRTGRRESLADYTARELRNGMERLSSVRLNSKPHPLVLPDLDGATGIRVFVQLDDDRMPAYRAPVVEVVALDDDEWASLRYPNQRRILAASSLKRWLSQVYPSGVMERTDPRTKRVYAIKSTEGQLSFKPAGADRDGRYAVLSGDVTFTAEGRDGFSYRGALEIVLRYPADTDRVQDLKGVFEGVYPRFDRIRNRSRQLPLIAVFESRPGA